MLSFLRCMQMRPRRQHDPDLSLALAVGCAKINAGTWMRAATTPTGSGDEKPTARKRGALPRKLPETFGSLLVTQHRTDQQLVHVFQRFMQLHFQQRWPLQHVPQACLH